MKFTFMVTLKNHSIGMGIGHLGIRGVYIWYSHKLKNLGIGINIGYKGLKNLIEKKKSVEKPVQLKNNGIGMVMKNRLLKYLYFL